MRHFLRHVPIAAVVAACAVAVSPARAAAVCGNGTYAYAGLDWQSVTTGISATIAQGGPLQVHAGHVAGWVGVVDPSSEDAWLQVGLSALPNDTTSEIYYEVAVPGRGAVYHVVRVGVAQGEPHRLAVLELRHRPSWWRVWVDGKPVSAPIHLVGSHLGWAAQALGESWAGAATGACNVYTYAFTGISAQGSRRHLSPVSNPNYRLIVHSRTSFTATSLSSGS